jgi:DNA transformation protein and related proteins
MSRRKPADRTSLRSLKTSSSFETFVIAQLSDLGDVVSRKMFGGVGLYCDGIFFGLIARDELYLKVDDQTRGSFEAAGSRPFRPYGDRAAAMQYYVVPLSVLESALDLTEWARRAVQVAAKAAELPRKSRKRPSATRRRS